MLKKPERLSDRIAQLIFPRIGSNMPPGRRVEDYEDATIDLLDQYAIGGLVLFNGDRFRTPHTLLRLQMQARFPLLIASDIERGAGQQIHGATVFPHALAFENLGEDDEDYAERAARTTAREALATGLHIGLGPVADIHSNPSNPIISLRAFGTTASNAGRLAAAWIRGSRSEGLLTCAKHFPGHGDTEGDSHDSLPVVDASRNLLEERELAPFRQTIEAGADLMMTAHVAYPALDDRNRPATASRPILRDLLRGDLGFRGAVISDSLLMEGVHDSDRIEAGEHAAKLLRAGVDILLDVEDVGEIIDYLTTAVRSGQLDESVVNSAFRRVWALKARMAARFGPGVFVDPGLAAPATEIGSPSNRRLADEIAAASITRISGSPEDSALRDINPETGEGLLGITVLANEQHADPTGSTFLEIGPTEWPESTWRVLSPDTSSGDRAELMELAANHRCVLLGVVVKPAAWHTYGLPDDLSDLASDLLSRPGSILACMGPASISERLTDASFTVGAHSDVEVSFRAVVRRMRALATASHDPVASLSHPLP